MKRLRRWLRKALGSRQFKRALAGLTLATSCFLFATVAHAAGGGHGGHGDLQINWWAWDSNAPPVGWFILDFIVFVVLMVYFGRKPIKAAFLERHERIKKAVAEATATFDKATSRYEEYKGKLANVEDEAARFVERGREDGKAERVKIVEQGEQYASRIRSDSEAIVGQELTSAMHRLQRDTARAVLKRTEEILRKGLTDDDRKRLVEDAIAHLEADEPPAPTSRRRSKSTQVRAGGAA